MAYDGTIPSLSNQIGNDIPQMQENFSLLESAQVVDEGSTADGDYIRYENGWQVTFSKNLTFIIDGSRSTNQFNLPVDYLSSDSYYVYLALSATGSDWTGDPDDRLDVGVVGEDGSTSSYARFRILFSGDGETDGDINNCKLFTIGRWE